MDETIIKIPTLFSQSGKNYHFNDKSHTITVDALKYAKTVISKDRVASLRFGVKWIKGAYVPIGRHFFIEIKMDDEVVIPIKFSSYYGIKKKLYTDKFGEIINAVWQHLFQKDLEDIAMRFKNEETLYISGVELDKNGIRWDEKELIHWDKVELINYKGYFVIKHADNYKFNTRRDFLTDWDAFLLQQVLKAIIDQRAKQADRKFGVSLN